MPVMINGLFFFGSIDSLHHEVDNISSFYRCFDIDERKIGIVNCSDTESITNLTNHK